MDNVELISEQNDTVSREKTSEVNDFIRAERNDQNSESQSDSNPADGGEQREEDDESPRTDGHDESKEEPVYQDVLGSGDLLKKIIKQGHSDDRPMKGEQVIINLVGRLEGNDDVVEEEKNLEITLGDCEVIQGVDLALSLMNLGETAELIVASRFAYGEMGLEPKIPGGAKLVYIIELSCIGLEIDPDKLTPVERLNIGLRKKSKGNWWYARNENTIALHIYRKALQYFGASGEKIGSDLANQNEIQCERVKTLNNMAVVHMAMNSLELALQTLDSVLTVEPNNEKALMRKGKVLSLKGQNMAAAHELNKALQLNPNNKTIQNILSNVKAALVRERAQERELYKKMLGQNDKSQKSTNDSNKSNTTYIISGLVAGLAVICGYCYLNSNFPFNKFNTL